MTDHTDAADMTEAEWYNQRTPTDGESYDRAGNVRPVPADVPNTPEEF